MLRTRRPPRRLIAKPPDPVSRKSFLSSFNLNKFMVNVFAFVLLAIALQYAERTRIGHETLDQGFDYLVRDNFIKSINSQDRTNLISPDLKLVFFDSRTYLKSYTKGYWTPRDELGLTILNCIKRGAKVVMVDFNFSGEAPVVVNENEPLDGNHKYLEHLQSAAILAKANKSVIIVPVISSNAPPPKGYVELLGRYREVFRPANFEALRDSRDHKIRRFPWFTYSAEFAPVLSSNLLGSLIVSHREENTTIRDAKSILVGASDSSKILEPKLVNALYPEHQKSSSRIIFNILPREVVSREFGTGLDITQGLIWSPMQVNSENLSEPNFKDKLVLIGSDFKDNGDFHDTAFGMISGSYILANSVNMVLCNRIINEVKGLNLGFLIIMGLLASFLYATYDSFLPTISFFGIAMASPWVSAWLFNKYGIFFDVWIPALGVGFFNLVVEQTKGKMTLLRAGILKNLRKIKRN